MSEIKEKEPAADKAATSSEKCLQDYYNVILRKSQEITLKNLKEIRGNMLSTYENLDKSGQIAWDMGEQYYAICSLIGQLEEEFDEPAPV